MAEELKATRPSFKPALSKAVTPPTAKPEQASPSYTWKDFQSDQDVRWCPGCGDYAILKAVQRALAEIGRPPHEHVFVSGIGCSSRFPYYVSTYGLHTIHGRATAVATGLKVMRPELAVWVITGDGDGLSIGGNHMLHILRRNVDVQILLFNNQIYGLTKGQFSPTSEFGKITKSSPYGSADWPVNPAAFALGAGASFIARGMDRDPNHLVGVIRRAYEHRGAAFVEIYQNCNVFNDGAFFVFTEKDTKPQAALFVEHGKPMVFGANRDKGIRLDGLKPVVVDLSTGQWSVDDLLVHDETDETIAFILTRMFDDPKHLELPRPFGVLYAVRRPTFEEVLREQVERTIEAKGPGDLRALLFSGETWTVV
ncbi:MAG: 2-oxoacid:ferredoxin oxidoreductase subunit beta [Bacteroidetes bacterium]|nr:2-oxoacid:ferredoxin oxidoreductase subunit beta [Rhodothermia bacterium]MCS7155387.1 2-oxoacid:ferredoxin oxidoreductase subunit beta [Bacteroidota bacterium]MCX7907520.1 2-oxoacid:ferredoxin oxidoreductase subunit beta [Bacteroidota bacterium]MDW8138514.1 2-oxoacid:ferredoxin oxidoreductase subunit beta [Bacteroidota bacterium]MDW8284549.1 2-oxoacid:ferredoxin oxidoreductase subunit beta [Bacteroidota bacterium]